MNIAIMPYDKKYIEDAIAIWNRVVLDGVAFPQLDCLAVEDGHEFFTEQSFTGLAFDEDSGEILGLYILHPNNIGRCGHICNASYAVKADKRGLGVGEALVTHCMKKGGELGFRILQFNAVVANNHGALHLYEKLGFVKLGVIPNGFLMKDGTYQDIVPHYHLL